MVISIPSVNPALSGLLRVSFCLPVGPCNLCISDHMFSLGPGTRDSSFEQFAFQKSFEYFAYKLHVRYNLCTLTHFPKKTIFDGDRDFGGNHEIHWKSWFGTERTKSISSTFIPMTVYFGSRPPTFQRPLSTKLMNLEFELTSPPLPSQVLHNSFRLSESFFFVPL